MTKYRATWCTGEEISGKLHDYSFSAAAEGMRAQAEYARKTGLHRGYAWEAVEEPEPEDAALVDELIVRFHTELLSLSLHELLGWREFMKRSGFSLDLSELTSPTVTTQEDTKSVILESEQ
jgi:hypothetical protein